jgi:D-mannonate dehydratase
MKWPERNRRLKRHLFDKREATHGELSSFHSVEQLLHAGDERGSPVAADHGDALMDREPRASLPCA